MKKHLKLSDGNKAYIPFNASLGLAEDPKKHNPVQAERWQILSPVRNHESGTSGDQPQDSGKVSRRPARLLQAEGRRPFGEQEIVWTDKVIQVINAA